MQIVDPNNLPKKPRKARALKGGEPFSAEPGATEASEEWKQAQLARLLLRNEAATVEGRYGSAWPTLDAVQDWHVSSALAEMKWDPEEKKYFTRSYYRFKVIYRYYRGQRSKSYLFWPQVCVPGYALKRQNFASGQITVNVETGNATYVRLGNLPGAEDRYSRPQEVWGLWKSEGTMKPRRTRTEDS